MMIYDGTGKLSPAIAELCGLSPKSQVQIAALIKQAKTALGITSKSKNLPDDVKLEIYQWHYDRLNSVQDIKQPESIQQDIESLACDEIVQDIKQNHNDELELEQHTVQNVKQPLTVQDEQTNDDTVYDFKQIHFAININHKGQAKRTTVMLEGYLLKVLQHKHQLANNSAIRTWIEQAIKTDNERFDSAAPLTRQVKRTIIESLV